MDYENYSEVENKVIEICSQLVIQLRGNQAGNGNAIINIDLINLLNEYLDLYHNDIENTNLVRKDIAGLLFYTCTRFYLQSKHSNNSIELLNQFNKLYPKILNLYMY